MGQPASGKLGSSPNAATFVKEIMLLVRNGETTEGHSSLQQLLEAVDRFDFHEFQKNGCHLFVKDPAFKANFDFSNCI